MGGREGKGERETGKEGVTEINKSVDANCCLQTR